MCNPGIHTCVLGMRASTCIDTCAVKICVVSMRTDMCMGMCVDMCASMRARRCVDRSIDMCNRQVAPDLLPPEADPPIEATA